MLPEFPLQARGLTRRFGATLAVDRLSLDVIRGEILGFLGPNGAGKTTSIRMMVGLLAPSAGEVLIEGQSFSDRRSAVQRLIGVCPQENILWEKQTCLEQLEFIGVNYGIPRRLARERGGELLEALGLSAKANELAGRLSGGMKRRLNLALALVHDPPILFLDEPEAGLDPQSRVLVRDLIRQLARRKTVVLTTHNMDEAERLADRVAIIDHGRLLIVDTPDALKRGLGEGAVLEVALELPPGTAEEPAIQKVLAGLAPAFPEAVIANGLLTLRGADLSARLPAVLRVIAAAGMRAGSVHIRANTLEDVFLSLTGRGLRE
ncbi:MAG: ABC transporter ATP-binding protein [Anaerolineales bacterium]|nr:ABC transporter ATP-binding protein [Anaerolineales bacterium]